MDETNAKLAQQIQMMQATLLKLMAASPGVVAPPGMSMVFHSPRASEAANRELYSGITVTTN